MTGKDGIRPAAGKAARAAGEPDSPSLRSEDNSASVDARVVSLAQEFMERYRRGERPTYDDFAAQYPELAADIRELFPMLCVLEDLGPKSPENRPPAQVFELGPLQSLGEYRIIREIGRGGMGVVYEAEQETLQRRVALKVLPFPAFQDKRQLDRFRMEAQAAARLHHGNIVPVFGVGEDRGVHFYAMQFIRGQTLAEVLSEVRRIRTAESAARSNAIFNPAPSEDDLLANTVQTLFDIRELADRSPDAPSTPDPQPGRLPESAHGPAPGPAPRLLSEPAGPPEAMASGPTDSTSSITKDSRTVYHRSAARLALQVAEALAYAHGEGILHRDIKPSNLILDLRGTMWITDFGLAKLQDSGEITASGSLVGTVRYMAPERLRGAGDARSDVYSLGVTLFELLTFRPAFTASERAELLNEIAHRDPPPPRRIDAGIPRDLETIVLKSIAKDPKDRYRSAAALADDLRRFINHQPVSARRASPPERLWRWCQRKPALAALVAVSAVLPLALAIGGIVSSAILRAERDKTFERLVASKLEEGRAWRFSRQPGKRSRSLAALGEAARYISTGELRNEFIGSLALTDLEEVSRRENTREVFAIDPAFERLAECPEDGAIHIYEGENFSRSASILPVNGSRLVNLRFSPGGGYIAGRNEGGKLFVWNVALKELIFEADLPDDRFPIHFDREAGLVAYASRDASISVRSLPGGKEVLRIPDAPWPNHLALDPENKRLAAGGCGYNRSILTVYDLATRAVVQRFYHPAMSRDAAWHPDGRMLASACDDFKVYLWDAASGERLQVLEGHSAEVTRLSFSFDGDILATSGWDNRTLLWSAKGGELLTESPGTLDAFSCKDRRIALHQGYRHSGVWKVNGGEVYRILHSPQSGKGPFQIDISPDGRWLAANCGDQGARLWRLDSQSLAGRIPAGEVACVQFQHDGSALWTGGREGLHRWPLRQSSAADGEWTLGPPEMIDPGRCWNFSLTNDGRRVAWIPDSTTAGNIQVLDLEAREKKPRGLDHSRAYRSQLSPSGRWMVSSPWQANTVKIWDCRDFSEARTFESGTSVAGFTPDERILAISSGSRLDLYECGSWTPLHHIDRSVPEYLPGVLAFSADSRTFAFGLTCSVIGLYRTEDVFEMARFEPPGKAFQLSSLAMTADGGKLAAATPQNLVQVWDLAETRRELKNLNLDWNQGEDIPRKAAGRPCSLTIDTGGLKPRGQPEDQARRDPRIIDLLSRRLEIDPGPQGFLERAALFARLGDTLTALANIEQALAVSPENTEALARRAELRERRGKLDDAVADRDLLVQIQRRKLAKANASPITRQSGLIDALRERAHLKENSGQPQYMEALADWEEIFALHPDDSEAGERLAWHWVLDRLGAGEKPASDASAAGAETALARAEKAFRAAPDSSFCRRTLGAVLYQTGKLQESRELFEKSFASNPYMFSAAFHLALIHHRAGNREEAARHYNTALEIGRTRLQPGTGRFLNFEKLRDFTARALGYPAPR